ncbi:uncharacterized protein LOC34622574 [Cyclospora cayetanensis]|uniref:Uncharacterized protein LOC34622574 n=1 Tax=Cyclospora cayetanensis TaxID=88456 RepID=A0A6P6RYF5_9EIME|nr:uncharacterized protein LOC34622574 [Cyclospora cayetanensis]
MEAQNPSKSSAAESPTESRESHSQLRSLQGMAVMPAETQRSGSTKSFAASASLAPSSKNTRPPLNNCMQWGVGHALVPCGAHPSSNSLEARDGSPMWCTYTSGRDAQFPANGLDSSVAREELDSVDFPEKAAVEAGDGSSIQPRVVPPEKVPPEGSVHAAFFAELDERGEIKNAPLSGRRLQRLATAAAAQGIRDPRVWASLSAQAIELNCASLDGSLTQQGGNSTQASSSAALAPAAQMFRHFEALQFLNSFLAAGFKDTDLLRSFEQIFLRQLHAFDCRHLLLLLHICEQHAYRARSLYLPLLRTLGALAPSLLFQEIADVFCCFATYQVGSSRCCLSLLKAAAAQVPNASLTDCSRLCGALHALRLAPEHEKVDKAASAVADAAGKPPQETCDSAQGAMEEAAWTVLALIERRVAFLIVGLPLQLLLDEVQTMPRLEFSWRPYETLADVELQKRLASLESAEDVDQLADPFATLQFLRNQGTVQQLYGEERSHVSSVCCRARNAGQCLCSICNSPAIASTS